MHPYKLCLCILLIGACLTTMAQAQGPKAPVVTSSDEIDARVQQSLENGEWSEESVALVKAVWEDFKTRLGETPTLGQARSLGSLGLPAPTSVETYVGQYGSGEDPAVLVEIKLVEGKLAVITRGRQVPAIIENNSVYFTSGDVAKSPLPSSPGKYHGMLELFAIVYANERYYIISAAGTSPPMQITKL